MTDELTEETIVEQDIIDEAEQDTTVVPIKYNITSFGADYDVDGLFKRLKKGDIFIPDFQRDYVWKLPEASRFIESLLLGLPVPGVFFAREKVTNKLLVIDGQQRLKSLQFFYDGYFNPQSDGRKRVFKLTDVQAQYEDKTYQTLDESDRIKLDNSIIHATIIKQESPDNDGDTSIYHIFQRLNDSGRKLYPQEIRVAVYYGKFMDMLKRLNEYAAWRNIYGKRNNRLKDQELILRFLALYHDGDSYKKPLAEFLNIFAEKHKQPSEDFIQDCEQLFRHTIDFIDAHLANTAFRIDKPINAAVFDSVMVGVAKRLQKGNVKDATSFQSVYKKLLEDSKFKELLQGGTSDDKNVKNRLEIACSLFDEVV
jgi:uncharacterized protein with ParB-like and HNH nuclease domain